VQPEGKCKESSNQGRGNPKKYIIWVKIKLAYFSGGKDLFTLYFFEWHKIYYSFLLLPKDLSCLSKT
jgi:hypothetical protein